MKNKETFLDQLSPQTITGKNYIQQLNSVSMGRLLRFKKRIFYQHTGTEHYPSDEEIYEARKLIRNVSMPVILFILWLIFTN